MQENVPSIATNSCILNMDRLYVTFKYNILYKEKTSQNLENINTTSLCHSYRIVKVSAAHFL